MEQKELKLDDIHMMEERLREVVFEMTMGHMIGWGPYLEDLKTEKEELMKKISLWKKQNQ